MKFIRRQRIARAINARKSKVWKIVKQPYLLRRIARPHIPSSLSLSLSLSLSVPECNTVAAAICTYIIYVRSVAVSELDYVRRRY